MTVCCGDAPRTPADDLLGTASGDNCVETITNAIDKTHCYLRNMGAKVVAHKSVLFVVCTTHRDRLRKHIWDHPQITINVANNFRDLGGHIDLNARASVKTSNDRLGRATTSVQLVAILPLPKRRITKRYEPSAYSTRIC